MTKTKTGQPAQKEKEITDWPAYWMKNLDDARAEDDASTVEHSKRELLRLGYRVECVTPETADAAGVATS